VALAFLPVVNFVSPALPSFGTGSLHTLMCNDIQDQELPDGGIIAVRTIGERVEPVIEYSRIKRPSVGIQREYF
jgi:hypothetical protein